MSATATLDKSAITLSVVCIVHCLAVPFAVVMMPSLAAYWFADEHFHLLLVYLVLPTSLFAIGLGCHRHRTYKIIVWGAVGLTVLVSAAMLGHDYLGEAGEKLLTIVGAVLVMIAHAHNFRLCRNTNCEG